MAGRVVFFLQSSGFEAAFQATSMAVTAAAMGDEVVCVFAFGALRDLVAGRFGAPVDDTERSGRERAEKLGALLPDRLLQEARGLGVRMLACDTTVRICGYEEAQVVPPLDEVLGLASIWRLTQGARTVSL